MGVGLRVFSYITALAGALSLCACAAGASRPVADHGTETPQGSTSVGQGSALLEYYLPRTIVSFQLTGIDGSNAATTEASAASDNTSEDGAGDKNEDAEDSDPSGPAIRQDLVALNLQVEHVADRRARFVFELRQGLMSNTDYELSVDRRGMLDTAFGSSQGALSAALDALGRNAEYTAASIRSYRAAMAEQAAQGAESAGAEDGETADEDADNTGALVAIARILAKTPAIENSDERRPDEAGDGFMEADRGFMPAPAEHFRFPAPSADNGPTQLGASPSALIRLADAATARSSRDYAERLRGRCTMHEIIGENCVGVMMVTVENPFASSFPREAGCLGAAALTDERCLIPLHTRIVAQPLERRQAPAPHGDLALDEPLERSEAGSGVGQTFANRHWTADAERSFPCEGERLDFRLQTLSGCRRYAYHASFVPIWLHIEQCLGLQHHCEELRLWETVRSVPVFAASESEYLAIDQRSAVWGSNAVVARFEDGRVVHVRHERNSAATEIATAPFVVINAVLSVPRNLFSGLTGG